MRKPIQNLLLLALAAGAPAFASAALIGEEDAKGIAAEFFQAGDVGRLARQDAWKLAYVATDSKSQPVCYVFNASDGHGFVIVSADSDAMPVIGYSDVSLWTPASFPGAAVEMISSKVDREIRSAAPFRAARAPQYSSRLLSTPTWSQEAPFNNNIPGRRLTGCVGVALAEIMKYHSFPANRPASLVQPGESSAYDWANMLDGNYRSGYENAQAEAVATLVADAAIAIGTDFGMSSSSAFEVKVPYALSSLFGYDAGVSYKKRSELSKADWDALIINEIDNERPVLYSGQDVSSGHAFVCDGYEMRGNTPFFHINWGWGGSADGYYASDALNPVVSKAHSYNDLMTVVYNIKPAADATQWSAIHITSDERQPGLTLDTDDISAAASFSVRAGSLKNISDKDFSGKIAVALFGADGHFKGLLSDEKNLKLISLQSQKYADFSCKLPAGVSVADGDVVRLATQAAGESAWTPVAGDLLAPGQMAAKGGQIPYFAVNIPSSEAGVEITAGEGRVIKGRDYSFKVVSTGADKVLTVRANGFILTPDTSDRYTLANVVEDQTIDIMVQDAADVLSKSTLWVEAGQLQDLLDDKATATITDLTLFGSINANDFTFIREKMKVERLDISQTNIVALGANPSNAIPAKAFSGYRSLKQIILPSNLAALKNGCFNNTGLTSIEIPASVTTYEYNIFVGCRSLQEVIVRRSAPAWVNWCVFEGTPKAKLVVPVGASGAYRSKENWQDFKEIVEENAVAADSYKVTVQDKKGLRFSALTEGTEFAPGALYSFSLDTDDSFGDDNMQVFANAERLYADASGNYSTQIKGNTLIHVEFKAPEPTTADKDWKLTGEAGGVGLVAEMVNVPFNRPFTVRANAIKVPSGPEASKFFAMVLTDKNGGIKEFISPVMTNSVVTTGNLCYNFTCQVREASVREGNEIRLATSYNKKNWSLVNADADSVADRLSARNNTVIYHNVNMPQSITGATIEGAATQVVRGMPLNVKVVPVSPLQRVTLAVNGVNKVVGSALANLSIPAVTEDLDITIQINDADASDYVVVNIKEGELASKIAVCPERLKLIGTMLISDFDALRSNSSTIIDLDLSDVTIKGAAMTANTIPSNAFAPAQSTSLAALRTILLPQNLERISDNAFARCTQLKEITVPASVSYVGDGALSSCVNLTKIVAQGSAAPATGNTSPFPADCSKISLEVPKGAESAYSTGFWGLLMAKVAKTSYWIKYDSKRAFVYNQNNYGDGTDIQVGGSKVQVSMGLPNCPYEAKSAGIYRAGVIFRLYDNGNEIKTGFAPTQYGYGGQHNVIFDPGVSSASANYPQNHNLDVVFCYPITFQNLAGADGVTAELKLDNADDRYNAPLNLFTYGANGSRVVYTEGKDYKFTLAVPSPNVELSVKVETKVMLRPAVGFNAAEYETRVYDVYPDEQGYYTIPALAGDTWVKVSGSLHVEEGEPIPAVDLPAVDKTEVEDFTEVSITGEMSDASFELIREKFDSLETLDLSDIDNESIPDGAFEGMENLRSVVLPPSVSEIGEGAFKDCENLETITLPGVTAIGEGAFEGCDNLTSIIIPSAGSDAGVETQSNGRRAPREGEGGISVESFRGLNPNCLIYMGNSDIPDAEALNIILNRDGQRIAASDIILDGNHPFNAPASFALDTHRISLTVDIPASLGSDHNDGWKGIMLPFSPSAMEYGEEFAQREGSGLHLMSFDDEQAVAMTRQTGIVANRPYMAHVSAPFASVPVTFYATTACTDEEFVYDVPFTPIPEETVAVGKDFSLFGSYNGETVLGNVCVLNETADSFIRHEGEESPSVRSFDAYLRANDDAEAMEHLIGEHPVWVFEPSTSVADGLIYAGEKVALESLTNGAAIYYTVDGTDPADAEGTRVRYESPIEIDGDAIELKAIAEFAGCRSDVVELSVALKRTSSNYQLGKNWTWISHNVAKPVALADFFGEEVVRVLSQTEQAERDPENGLVGSLKELAPAVAYKVCVDAPEWKTQLEGAAVNPANPVALHKGWNWIGAPNEADASTAVADLLSAFTPEEGDMIVGLEGFSQADTKGEWKGTLSDLNPGLGYLFFSSSDKTLQFTMKPATEEAAPEALVDADDVAPWTVDIHAYPSVMPLTAQVIGTADKDASDYFVGAFSGEECRGIGALVDDVLMLNIHGEEGDNITFRFLSNAGEELRSVESLPFAETPVSTIAHPYELNLAGATALETIAADGFELTSENGALLLTGDLTGILSVEIHDLDGTLLALENMSDASGSNALLSSVDGKNRVEGKKSRVALNLTNQTPGIRLITVRTLAGPRYFKLLLK